MWVATEEVDSGYAWHWSRADELVTEFDDIERNGSARNSMAVLRDNLRKRVALSDMSRPSGVDLSPTDPEPALAPVWTGDADPQATKIWTTVLGHLQRSITRPNYDTWLAVTVGLDWTSPVFTVGCPSAFNAEMLEQRMYSLIAQTIEDVVECEVEVVFAVREESG